MIRERERERERGEGGRGKRECSVLIFDFLTFA